MIGRVNAGGGGGLQSTDAILRVIAPAGSTVTISKGGVSKSDAGHENKDDNTLYDYYFIIHQSQFDSVNPWTVTATLGSDTKSNTVIIDSADEYDLILLYGDYYYDSGDEFVDITGGWIATGSTGTSGGSIVKQPTYLELKKVTSGNISAMTTNTIALSEYSTISFVLESKINNSAVEVKYGVSISGGSELTNAGYVTANSIYNTETILTYDISSISSGHPAIRTSGSSGVTGGSIYIYKVFAER